MFDKENFLMYFIYSDYITNYYKTLLSDTKLKHFNEMTGNIPELYDPYRDIENIYPIYESTEQTNRYFNTIPSIEGRHLIIPIPFWFSKYNGLVYD